MKFKVKSGDKYLLGIPDWGCKVTDKIEEAYIFQDEKFFKEHYPQMELIEIKDE